MANNYKTKLQSEREELQALRQEANRLFKQLEEKNQEIKDACNRIEQLEDIVAQDKLIRTFNQIGI